VELTLFITTPYWADNPGKHPHYLHALPDLRDARVHLERRDTDPVDHADKQTIEMIDVAELKQAAQKAIKKISDATALDTAQITEIFKANRGASMNDIVNRLREQSRIHRAQAS
jgi:hypothetical protein